MRDAQAIRLLRWLIGALSSTSSAIVPCIVSRELMAIEFTTITEHSKGSESCAHTHDDHSRQQGHESLAHDQQAFGFAFAL